LLLAREQVLMRKASANEERCERFSPALIAMGRDRLITGVNFFPWVPGLVLGPAKSVGVSKCLGSVVDVSD